MKTRSMIIAMLLAATAVATAQTAPPANDSQAATPAPPAIQNAVPDKIAPADNLKARAEPKAGDTVPETTGEAVGQSNGLTAPPKPGETAQPIDRPDPKSDLPHRDTK